jgi:hypothetical protein
VVEEVVVTNPLSQDAIEAGITIVGELDARRFPPAAAFWFYVDEASAWRLILAFPGVDKEGAKKAYRRVQKVLSKAKDPRISLQNITVLDERSPLVALLRKAIRTGPGISRIRFSRNSIDGVFIEDAYVYRLN